MNVIAVDFEPQPRGVSVSNDGASLGTLMEPDCAAVLWKRHMPRDMRDWLAAQAPGHLPQGRVTLQHDQVADVIASLCEISDLPKGPEQDWLIADIAELASNFAGVMETTYLRLRLDVVTTNACRKLHLDALKARLACTYRGTGTQYGTAAAGDDPETVFTVQTGDPILLRGSMWPTVPACGLLHRSPPIEGTGETRLVLVLDPVSEPEVFA